MKPLVYSFLLFLSILPLKLGAVELLGLFSDGGFWKKSPNDFILPMRKYGFKFLDERRQSAISMGGEDLSFGGLPVCETRVYWQDDVPSRVEISVYNRGDVVRGDRRYMMDEERFAALAGSAKDAITEEMGKGYNLRTERLGDWKFASSVKWESGNLLVLLESAYRKKGQGGLDRFSAEYLKVVMVPGGGERAKAMASLTGKGIMARAKSFRALKESVAKNPRGDVFIDGFPMVDQGDKGYCAAATLERILRHYGLAIDQHRVAQLAETTRDGGTSFEGFSAAASKIAAEHSLLEERIIKHEPWNGYDGSELEEDLKYYNKTAKRLRKSAISVDDYMEQIAPGHYSIDVFSIYCDMDPEILLVSKKSREQRFKSFCREISKNINLGVPLIWSCFVGIYPEVPEINTRGVSAHMRLIIGYNQRTEEIIYTDSWGGAHSFKRMPIGHAWAMTRALSAVKPRN